jgi:PadR family transcriptional regulator, regulatory protein PadR
VADDFQRITPQLLAVLAALLDAPNHETHGWPLMKATGLCGPSVYRNLERCEDAGLVSSRWEDSAEPGKPRRRLYRLSPDGAARARALLAERRHTPVPGRLRTVGGIA